MKQLLIGTVVGAVPRTWLRRLLWPLGKAKLNETDLLVSLAEAMKLRGVMVDVGARYGTSLAPFLRRGWKVLAFEPDPANRWVLRWLRPWLPDFEVDIRACADEPAEGVTFFVNPGHSAVSSLSLARTRAQRDIAPRDQGGMDVDASVTVGLAH